MIRYVTKGKRIADNLYFSFDFPTSQCDHKACSCVVKVRGKHVVTQGYQFDINLSDYEKSLSSFAIDCGSKYDHVAGYPIKKEGDREQLYFLTKLVPKKGRTINMRVVPAPISHYKYPTVAPYIRPHYSIYDLIKQADMRYWDAKGVSTELVQRCWCDSVNMKTDSLAALCLNRLSIFNSVYGKINGRPMFIAAADGLFDGHKYADAVGEMVRETHVTSTATKEAFKNLPQALDLLYLHLGSKDKIGKYESTIELSDLNSSYLGSSEGLQRGYDERITLESGTSLRISPSSKKAEMFLHDIRVVMNWLEHQIPFQTYWDAKEKNEIRYTRTKQEDDKAWNDFLHSVRLFVIPSGPFIILERLLCTMRHLIERGGCITIGHCWSGGGAARLAERVGISLANCFALIMVEGDIKKFDLSVLACLVDLYVSSMLVYEKPGSIIYEIKKRALTLLLNQLIARLTHVFASIWAIILGEVPSGCFDTSHMDSWIMCLYFFLFAVWQSAHAPPEHTELIEAHLLRPLMVGYGDDHIYNKSEDAIVSSYLGGHEFADFMKVHFGADVRDLEDGIPFISLTNNGWLLRKGTTFLRHQIVLNPYADRENQPWCLPFRETWEYVIRAVVGRVPKERDALDVALSCLGHVYGTYASNQDAYDRLWAIFQECCIYLQQNPRDVARAALGRLNAQDLGELRRRGISKEDLEEGFPTMEHLIKKNEIDHCRQERLQPMEVNYDSEYFD